MLVGELDHENLLNPSTNGNADDVSNIGNSSQQTFSAIPPNEMTFGQHAMAYLWYIAVIVMVTLVLMNLLVGLAVSDIQGIRENAEIYVIQRRIRLIAYLEKLFLEALHRPLGSLWNMLSVKDIVSPAELRNFKITVLPNCPKFKDVSKETKQAIKKWIVSSSSVSNFLIKCKGSSPDSGSTLKRAGKRNNREQGQGRPSSFVDLQGATGHVTLTDRLNKLETALEEINEKLEAILEGRRSSH